MHNCDRFTFCCKGGGLKTICQISGGGPCRLQAKGSYVSVKGTEISDRVSGNSFWNCLWFTARVGPSKNFTLSFLCKLLCSCLERVSAYNLDRFSYKSFPALFCPGHSVVQSIIIHPLFDTKRFLQRKDGSFKKEGRTKETKEALLNERKRMVGKMQRSCKKQQSRPIWREPSMLGFWCIDASAGDIRNFPNTSIVIYRNIECSL